MNPEPRATPSTVPLSLLDPHERTARRDTISQYNARNGGPDMIYGRGHTSVPDCPSFRGQLQGTDVRPNELRARDIIGAEPDCEAPTGIQYQASETQAIVAAEQSIIVYVLDGEQMP
ncbi:hypothetical protein FNAPI_8529 [Fusarium napiforme]|uniref:Uncharacterized protein n=1 Tax=Fusarium napiforme TaxID=42672 RepID=A0A8H5J266_9HYPO|nr:hypothetical protein FNAPI_8529 [Fusarium napiforme]